MKRKLTWLLVGTAFLAGAGLALLIALTLLRQKDGPKFASTATVVLQIQSLSELVTVKYVLEKVVSYDDPKYFADLIPLGENKITLLAHGVVKAGVDLSKVSSNDVMMAGEKITLTLPRATPTDAYLDDRSTQVLDQKTGLLRRFDKDMERTARQHALAEIQRAARVGGIEKEANERAREAVGKLLHSLGYREIEVRTRDNP